MTCGDSGELMLNSLVSAAIQELDSKSNKRKLQEIDLFGECPDSPSNEETIEKHCLTPEEDELDDEFNKNVFREKYEHSERDSWKKKNYGVSVPQKVQKTDVEADPIFGIRIINPLISSTVLQERMIGRNAVPLSRLRQHVSTLSKQNIKDWVIAGVVVCKSTVRTSQSGTQYIILTLSDLNNDLKSVSLFLFGNAYKGLWKTTVGTVVGVLNPSVLNAKEGSKEEVCRRFNEIGSKLLSRGFIQIERRHSHIYKKVKSMLPRRESERRVHPLARYCDILSAVETRISMLNMTFMKYIDSNVCCFIPGKVLDEIERILLFVEKGGEQPPPRTHELLQELRDISSMAMEHFDENILPNLKFLLDRKPVEILPFGGTTSKPPRFLIVHNTISGEIKKLQKQNNSNKKKIGFLNQQMNKLFKKLKRQSVRLKSQSTKIREQERKIKEQTIKIQEQEASTADMKKHMEEWDQKFSDLTAELVRAQENLISKTFSPKKQTTVFTRSLSPPKLYKSNIKPRMAQILTPRSFVTSLQVEMERKRKCNQPEDEIPTKLAKPVIDNEINTKANKTISSNIVNNLNIENEARNKSTACKNQPSNQSGIINEISDSKGLPFKNELSSFLTSSFENFLKTPLSSIKSRKRKISEEIDLK